MKINLASVFVDDQDKALSFYTETLGFVKKTEMPVGEFKWLTVVSPEDPDGVELVLEPSDHPAVKPFKDAIVARPGFDRAGSADSVDAGDHGPGRAVRLRIAWASASR